MRIITLTVLLLIACGKPPCDVSGSFSLEPGEKTGPLMRPGANCLRCHVASGEASRKPFSFGGTVFPKADSEVCDGVAGVTIRATDSTGKVVEAVSNEVGNFWSAEPLTPPLSLEARKDGRVQTMPGTTPTGGCALCHSWPDAVSALGRIRSP
jgi:hypothetical protein